MKYSKVVFQALLSVVPPYPFHSKLTCVLEFQLKDGKAYFQ